MSSTAVMTAEPAKHLKNMLSEISMSFKKYIIKKQNPPQSDIVQCVYPRHRTSIPEYPAAPTKKIVIYFISNPTIFITKYYLEFGAIYSMFFILIL